MKTAIPNQLLLRKAWKHFCGSLPLIRYCCHAASTVAAASSAAVSSRRKLKLGGLLWQSVLATTGQPPLVNPSDAA